MYVKSLTLKGFKSFASSTTLRLEPGITCIVGPNGSGKSNVVDALAWVMGEQGAKSLRGGKMEDVIFAGTSGRQPLGRAEVSMTIDNSDGALPIDYSEVTITRTMFRSGGSEYAINGTGCRLLDIQELLSDSGIGREMHVIVGQGQLDQVLRATPEERRGFIEEAAGVLKHRKRKERALRKLATMEGNLTRLTDLTAEIRRQLGPLGRQAETARRAATIQAEVRDARLRILADDLVQLTSALEQEMADERALVERRTRVQASAQAAEAQVTGLEEERARSAPVLQAAQDRWYSLSSLLERLRALRDLAAERVRLLGTEEEDLRAEAAGRSGARDPEQLRAQAAQIRQEESALLARVEELAAALAKAEVARQEAEAAHAEEQARLQRLARAAADRREGLARLSGQVSARRSRIEAGEGEITRLQAAGDEHRTLQGGLRRGRQTRTPAGLGGLVDGSDHLGAGGILPCAGPADEDVGCQVAQRGRHLARARIVGECGGVMAGELVEVGLLLAAVGRNVDARRLGVVEAAGQAGRQQHRLGSAGAVDEVAGDDVAFEVPAAVLSDHEREVDERQRRPAGEHPLAG